MASFPKTALGNENLTYISVPNLSYAPVSGIKFLYQALERGMEPILLAADPLSQLLCN